jgi:hypothetical protein
MEEKAEPNSVDQRVFLAVVVNDVSTRLLVVDVRTEA